MMGSLVDELQRREAAARAEAEELRGRIAALAERLAQVEEQLPRLVIAREVADEVLDGLLRNHRRRRCRRALRCPLGLAARL
ncbi:MAG TPA: hypothetical protein VFQ68_05245 [Streptosporangiaceae bacterium]|nr:hypothetical protein [Streptosporangiaceae bacterium]